MSKPIYKIFDVDGKDNYVNAMSITFIEALVQQVRVIEPDIVRPFE